MKRLEKLIGTLAVDSLLALLAVVVVILVVAQ